MALLNIAGWIDCTEVEGPGKRFAVWTQGCMRRCPGCCNPHMFDFMPRHLMDSSELLAHILEAMQPHALEGISFLGGEPTLQARGLAEVACAVRTRGMSVMVFTGYYREELAALGLPGVAELLSAADILVEGPYQADLPEQARNWAGSTNQRVTFLSSRYHPGIEYDPHYPHGFEIRFRLDGQAMINGQPIPIDL